MQDLSAVSFNENNSRLLSRCNFTVVSNFLNKIEFAVYTRLYMLHFISSSNSFQLVAGKTRLLLRYPIEWSNPSKFKFESVMLV